MNRHLPLLFALLLPACSSSNDTPLEAGVASGDVLIADLPADDLSSFSAVVAAVRLERSGAGATTNLIAGPVDVELLGLGGNFRWLASSDVAVGTYDTLAIDFQPFGYRARSDAGAAVTVDAVSDTLTVAFAQPLVVAGDDYVRFEVDLDLEDSLSGDVASGTITFDPTGSVLSSSGDDSVGIDEIDGTVVSIDASSGSLVLDAFADGDLSVPLGEVAVSVEPGAMLVRDDGTLFADADTFFAALQVGQSVLEVHGQLRGGEVAAHRIELEDGVGGGAGLVRIEGRIVDLDSNRLELQIVELEKEVATAAAVLAELGDPATIEVALSAATTYVLDDGSVASESALAVGQEIKVRFAAFVAEPFPAARIEIESIDPELEGRLVDVSELPDRATMRLRASDPAIAAGLVESTSTDVLVELGAASVLLDTDGDPVLTASALLAGMEVKVHGTLTGEASAPTVDASRVVVRAGRLDDAVVVAVDSEARTFETVGGEIDDPFGGDISAGPLRIVLDEAAVVEGDLDGATSFFDAATQLLAGGSIEVRVKGIASGAPDEIRAFELDVRLESD